MADSNRTVLRQQQPKSSEDGPGIRPAFTPPEAVPLKKPTLYPRTRTFWGFESGPDYGSVSAELAQSPDVLLTRVGSFLTKGPGLPLPAALRAPQTPTGAAYFLIQFTPAAFAPGEIENSLRQIAASGATLIDYVPNNAYLVKVNPSSYAAVASSRLVQYVAPYHPGYKIAKGLGTAPLPDAEMATSTVYKLYISGFPGTAAAEIAAQVTALGGTVTRADDGENGPVILADLNMDKVVPLARIEGVRSIDENLPRFPYGEESSWNVIAGTYIIGQKPALYLAGVTGAGGFKTDVNAAPAGVGDPRAAGAEDTDWNGDLVIDNSAQIIADTDTGMSVDGGDFSETAFTSGFTGAGGGPTFLGPNIHRSTDGTGGAANHRKIAWYEAAPGSFGTGDNLSCDPSGSHGTVTSGQACGNASSGPFTADGADWSGDAVNDNYGDPNTADTCGPGFCFVNGAQTYRVDGVAYGARLVFQDVNNVCPEPSSFAFGNYATLLGDARTKGARIHTYSFGAFSTVSGTLYDGAAQAIDTFLATDANRDYMLFIAAGNAGSSTANIAPSPKANTLGNEASSKNAIVLGANLSGNATALQSRAAFSSVGPAPNGNACSPQTGPAAPAASNCGRVKPDLMAPGQDGNTGLSESYNCVSNTGQSGAPACLNLGGNSGTSFSTPNAAGAGALVRDYFAQGLYPDGTSSNPANAADRRPHMSGAMVKALLIASATDMNGGGLTNPTANDPGYVHRFNPETGYGFVNLRHALPLVTDPNTPGGLIVHDAGCPNVVGSCAAAPAGNPNQSGCNCPSNLSLPASLATSTSAFADFDVLDATQELRLALTWIEPIDTLAVGAIRNDLNLELRYCGADNDCTTNSGDIVYYGNVFSEDRNDDGTEDQDLDGTAGMLAQAVVGHWRSEGSWSLPNKGNPGAFSVEAARDTQNNVEAIYLSPDPELDGTSNNINPVTGQSFNFDNQIKTGKWRVTVAHTATGPDAQKYALAIAGAVTVDSSIRLDTNPLSCNGEVAVTVSEVPKAATVDPACNTGGCTEATIESRTKITVKTQGGSQVDLETASGSKVRFNLTKDANTLSFKSGKIPVSTAGAVNNDDDIIVATDGYTVTAEYTDTDCNADGTALCQGTPAETVVKSSQAVFDCTPNVDFFAIGQPGRNAVFLLAGGCDTDKFFDSGEVFTYLVQFANLEDTLTLDDLTVTLRAVTPDADNSTDPGRLNNASSPFVTVATGTQFVDRVFPGFLETAGFTVTVNSVPAWSAAPAAPPEVEMVVGISSNKAGKSAPSYGVFSHLLNADEEKFLYSTDYPTGATVDQDINSNEQIENPIRDLVQPFPQGNQRNNFDKLNETITFADMTTTAFGGGNPGHNGPWDFDTNDEGFRSGTYAGNKGNTAEITNWGEDKDYDGSMSGPYICKANPSQACACTGNPPGGCDPGIPACPAAAGADCVHTEDFDGDQDGTLDEGWSLAGGCGYLSSNGTNRGVWHTGQIGPIGAATCSSDTFPANPVGSGVACETLDTVPGTAAMNLWFEFLRTPVIQKVHRNTDNRNLDFRVELADWRWNVNADYQADLVGFNWEFDENTASLDPVDLGDGAVLRQHDDGMGPINGANVNLTGGFPMFNDNDQDDDVAGFAQKPAGQGRNRASDRGCLFQNLTAAQVSVTAKLLRDPKPSDDDCDNDIVSYGPDGCPGLCGVDDDGDGFSDNPSEACPCFGKQDGIDDDGDGRKDEGDELQRFYHCSGNPTLYCNVGPTPGADDCPVSGQCGRFGDGKPKPYGDDVCGDGSIDEGVSSKWAAETALGENGHRIAQNQSWSLASVNGPFLRFATLEDTYDSEAGNSFQGAIGFIVFEGTTGNIPKHTYGLAVDDVTVEWTEAHPVEQAAAAGCGNKTCASGPRAGKLCFNQDDCGGANVCSGATSTGSACAALTFGTRNLFSGSGVVSLNVVDFNAETTQGGFDCTPYGFSGTCGGSPCTNSNDCDSDGLKEVQVELRTAGEPNPERFRLEQTASGSTGYTGLASVSSLLNAAGDGTAFLQYNGTLTPSVTALYFDNDSGAGDANGDGTQDGPPSNGRDGCPGFCGVDDDLDAVGPDKRAGAANSDDDGNGICDYKASNPGAQCTVDSNCPGGNCLKVDEANELCGRVCTAGTTSGHCSGSGTVCNVVGGAPCPGTCIADNCNFTADCGTGGSCPGTCIINGVSGAACQSAAACVGGYCAGPLRGDDNCNLIDEPNERCAIVSGKLALGIDDNCGCKDNPVTDVLNATFDVADIVVAGYTMADNGDNDGYADDNELVTMSLSLRNLSSFDVENIQARITTQDATIACINDPAASFGRINTLATGGNLDALQFTVGSVGRTSITDIKQATFVVTITGTAILEDGSRVPIEGTATPQQIPIDLDLDVNGAAPGAAKTTKLFSFESTQYASDAAWSADWAHTFFDNQAGLHCLYNNGTAGTRQAPVGCFLRQDPGTQVPDDWHLHATVHAGGIPDGGRDSGAPGICSGGKTPGISCGDDSACPGTCAGGKVPGELCTGLGTDCRGACSGNTAVRCSFTNDCLGIGKCTSPAPGTCTSIAPGTCAGIGNSSMHQGVHAGTVDCDTTHLDNIFYAYYKPTVQVGLGRPGTDDSPILDFWHQMSETDDRIFSNLGPPYSLGACTVQALVDRNADGTLQVGPPTDITKDGWWDKLVPFYGIPAQQRFPAGNCTFDPNDDGNNENDELIAGSPTFKFNTAGTRLGYSSTCYPEFIWACSGDTQDPPYDPNVGGSEPSTACFTEVDAAGNPIFREGPGPGRWIESKFNLYRYRGRQIWVRYLVSDLGIGFDTWSTGFSGCLGGNRDDGWFIDDLKFIGTNSTKFTLKADTDVPPASSCPTSNCSTITPKFSASSFLTRTDGRDNDGDSTTDESDEGIIGSICYAGTTSGHCSAGSGNPGTVCTTPGAPSTCTGILGRCLGDVCASSATCGTGGACGVPIDAPFRSVDLNGQDLADPTTSNCLNGVLQYRFWDDANSNNTLDAGELIRDYTENPHATANPLRTENSIKMDVKCSAPAPNTCMLLPAQSSMPVILTAGRPGGLFNALVFDQAVSPAGKNILEWTPVNSTAKYDIATKQGVSTNPVANTGWLNPAGYFDSMVCGGATPGGGNAIACNDSDLDGRCEFAISADNNPAVDTFDMWVIRETTGSYNEIGGTSLASTSRDTRMADDGSPVCVNTTLTASSGK